MKFKRTQTGDRVETRYGDYEISKCPRGYSVTWISPAFSGDDDMVVAITKTKAQAESYVRSAMQAKGLTGLSQDTPPDMDELIAQAQEEKYNWIDQEQHAAQREEEKRTAPPAETNEQKAQKWEKRMWIPISLSLLGIGVLWWFGRRK